MNERIEQLLEQARAEECFWFGSKPATTVGYDELEKFAELIAKEQIEICRDMFIVGSVSWNLLNEKLEHFGVEE
jgi:hypothetical protein